MGQKGIIAMTYQPRRASSRWVEGAPEYILDCFDNMGKSADRYTILFGGSLLDPSLLKFRKVHMLCLNDMPTDPWFGVSMWGEVEAWNRPAHYRRRWLDLPENVREHIIMRAES